MNSKVSISSVKEYFENISLIKKNLLYFDDKFWCVYWTKKAQVCSISVYVYCYDRYTYNYDIMKINGIFLLFSEENIQSKLRCWMIENFKYM